VFEKWGFGKAAAQIFLSGASEDKKFAAKPANPDSNFSNTFGITVS